MYNMLCVFVGGIFLVVCGFGLEWGADLVGVFLCIKFLFFADNHVKMWYNKNYISYNLEC